MTQESFKLNLEKINEPNPNILEVSDNAEKIAQNPENSKKLAEEIKRKLDNKKN